MQIIPINESGDANQRIDKFLKKYFPHASLGSLYKWLRTGKIKVNKKKVGETYRLCEWDSIECHLSEEEISSFRWTEEKTKKDEKHTIKLIVLYEDETLIALSKPPGMNVHPGDHKTKEVSLIELVQDSLWKRYDTLTFRPSLVHRIDRDTSGVILVAKEKKMLEALLTLLQSGKIEKTYHTLVLGKPEKPRDTIDRPLLRIDNAHDEAKVRVDPLGQRAITHYKTFRQNIHKKYSLLECHIETGRTHQIRVHLASIGYPILWDKAYGNPLENSYARKYFGINRQLLHAYSLSFLHPILKKQITIVAPYERDFVDILNEKDI